MSFLISAAGLFLLSGVNPADSYLSGVLPGMLVTSIGCGLTLPALTGAALSGTTEENAGLGSAGFSLGITVAATLLVLGAVLVAALLLSSRPEAAVARA